MIDPLYQAGYEGRLILFHLTISGLGSWLDSWLHKQSIRHQSHHLAFRCHTRCEEEPSRGYRGDSDNTTRGGLRVEA